MITNEISLIIQALKEGKNAAIPTETVYGLAGMINHQQALENIFTLKGRPHFDPLIVHFDSIDKIRNLVLEWSDTHQIIAENFWPGPLTLILKKNEEVHDLITAGLPSVGVRIPNHPLTLEVLKKLETGVAAPSANKFKKVSPTKATHVYQEFGDDIDILDGGECQIGIESTIIEVFEKEKQIKIYRPGQIKGSELHQLTGYEILYQESPVAPGQLEEHYRPQIPLILIKDIPPFNILEKYNLEHNSSLNSPHYINLPETPQLAARKLYSLIREYANDRDSLILELKTEYFENENWQGIINRLIKAKSALY